MKIAELQAKQGKIELQAEVIEMGQVREFQKFGNSGKVCNAKLRDDSGSVALTLWNEQVDQVKVGDVVKISNGYVNEWQGELQLSTGKFGSLEVVSSGAAPSESTPSEPEVVGAGVQDIRPDEEQIQ